MSPEKTKPCHQPQLPLSQPTLWHQFPEPTRVRCRQLLSQLLRQVVLNLPTQRSDDERKN